MLPLLDFMLVVLAEILSEATKRSLLMITIWFSDLVTFPTIPSNLEFGLAKGQVK